MCESLILSFLIAISSTPSGLLSDSVLKHGDPLPRIELCSGYFAEVFCTDINGVDGLAISCNGDLYAVSESDGCIYRIDREGYREILADGLKNPEGIAINEYGVIYVVEDIKDGRLLAFTPSGDMQVLAENLNYPEGVAVEDDGAILFTESSLESGSMLPFLTGVKRIGSEDMNVVHSSLYLWSYSDLAVDSSGMIYVCNELSGYGFIQESVIRINPLEGTWSVFCKGLHSCEGICFGIDGAFPMYVVEEDIGGGSGRISIVDETGASTVFAEGFRNIEDIAVDRFGRIFISEDSSGMIIIIQDESYTFR